MNANKTRFKSLDKLGADPRIEEIYQDDDGIWLYPKAGFCTDPETHTIHENTVAEVIRAARRDIRPCTCRDCEKELAAIAQQATVRQQITDRVVAATLDGKVLSDVEVDGIIDEHAFLTSSDVALFDAPAAPTKQEDK